MAEIANAGQADDPISLIASSANAVLKNMSPFHRSDSLLKAKLPLRCTVGREG